MKLSSLLESSGANLSFEYLEKFRDPVGDSIASMVEKFKKAGFKLIKIDSEPDDSFLPLLFSNGFLECEVAFDIRPTVEVGGESIHATVECSILEKFRVESQKDDGRLVFWYRFSKNALTDEDDIDIVRNINSISVNFIQTVTAWNEWAFEILSETDAVKFEFTDDGVVQAVLGKFDTDSLSAKEM